jgi:arginyl-tRNA synthetase
LKDGAMSTRKWKIIKLDALLDEAKDRAKKIILEKRDDIKGEELEELSETIGICAIKYGYLSKHRQTDVIFDWDEFMSFEWNSGPYIAYSFVRANKLLSDNSELDLEQATNYSYEDDSEVALIKEISNYRNVLLDATKENTPHTVATYAYGLTKKFSTFYNDVKINADENDIKIARLKLVSMYSLVLKEAMDVLAIKLPNKM